MPERPRIAVIGASGTYGVAIERSCTWPHQLERRLRRDGTEAQVGNFSSPGLPLTGYAERVLLLEREWSPDIYLVQLPPPGRAYFGVNGAGGIPERTHGIAKVLGWKGPLDASFTCPPTRICLTRLLARPGSPFFPSLERWVYPVVRDNAPETGFDEFAAFASFWDRHTADSDLQHVMHGKEVVALQHLFAQLGRSHLMFDWHVYNVRTDRRLGLFADHIAWDRFIGEGRVTAFEFLESATSAALDRLTVDMHGHLNEEGHRLLAEVFVAPALAGGLAVAKARSC